MSYSKKKKKEMTKATPAVAAGGGGGSQGGIRVEQGPLKTTERAMQKTQEEYGGDYSRLLDLARCSVVFGNAETMAGFLNSIATLGEFPVAVPGEER